VMFVIRERAVPVVLSVLIIVLVAVAQQRSRYLAALFATMPLTAPLAMWIVFSASEGDQRQTADFVGSMVLGFAASLVFILVCWFGLRQAWGFLVTLLVASAIWLAVVLFPRWVGDWMR
jgi:uncharacterized membrane protein (GlpM family)